MRSRPFLSCSKSFLRLATLAFWLVAGTAHAQSYILTVTNGFEGGDYSVGDTVPVWSQVAPDSFVFVEWTGTATPWLERTNEWRSNLIVDVDPMLDTLTLQANFTTLPFSPVLDSADYWLLKKDTTAIDPALTIVFYVMPPDPKGLVFFFHGTGATGRGLSSIYEGLSIMKDLAYAGYGVVTLDANEVTAGDQPIGENPPDGKIRWLVAGAESATATNNIDIRNVKALKESLVVGFNLSTEIPCFSIGQSNGAWFSDLCASVLGFCASAHLTAEGASGTYTRPDLVPVVWILARNDQTADSTAALANYATILASGTATALYWLEPSPVIPERFGRSLSGVAPSQADSVFTRLSSEGVIDANGMLTSFVNNIDDTLLYPPLLNQEQETDVRQQLLCANAEHVVLSDFNKTIIQFFEDALAVTSVTSPEIEVPVFRAVAGSPNPFKYSTTIQYDLERDGPVTIAIYEAGGRRVKLLSRGFERRGRGHVVWDGRNASGAHVASGTYFARIRTESTVRSGKIVLQR